MSRSEAYRPTEIEITPEMVAAGENVLWTYLAPDGSYPFLPMDVLAKEVFLAFVRASRLSDTSPSHAHSDEGRLLERGTGETP